MRSSISSITEATSSGASVLAAEVEVSDFRSDAEAMARRVDRWSDMIPAALSAGSVGIFRNDDPNLGIDVLVLLPRLHRDSPAFMVTPRAIDFEISL